tara:strand:+ start:1224 stop:1412 length:189 start_codon:yes stop_codon:yes gene_type:complete
MLTVVLISVLGLIMIWGICFYHLAKWFEDISDVGFDEGELQSMCWGGLRNQSKSFSYEETSP